MIRAAVRARKNILVVGSTGSGKTTLVNAILDSLAQLTPHDRVISIEDTTELQCPVKNYLDLRAVGGVTMLDCLRACMRLKPTRIVVGEVRGAEAHTLLKGLEHRASWRRGDRPRQRCPERIDPARKPRRRGNERASADLDRRGCGSGGLR